MKSERLMRRQEVEVRCGLARSSIYRLMRQGKFPAPLKVGARAVRWSEGEIERRLLERPRAHGDRGQAAENQPFRDQRGA